MFFKQQMFVCFALKEHEEVNMHSAISDVLKQLTNIPAICGS